MHDATVRALIETALELSEGQIPHARSLQEAAKLRDRLLILQGTLADLWPEPTERPARLTPAQLVDALRSART